MSVARLFASMKLSQRDAEVIFDRDEPVGHATDIVLPRRRWFRKRGAQKDIARTQSSVSAAHGHREAPAPSAISPRDQQS